MRIQIAEKTDFLTVKTITQTTILSVYPKYYPAGAVRFFSEHHSDEKILNDILAGKVYLLETEGGTAGTVTISGNEINRLFVLPGYQGRGYGSQLMDFAEQMIRRESDTVILDASLPAKKMYLQRGYRNTAYQTIETDNGDYLCYDVMERSFRE
ncbi:MAG: GNAT family N-acetyltransferase [Solobacterium sp.]|nr:GNAT family N-acetyltransferase [Solobacterium sp.]